VTTFLMIIAYAAAAHAFWTPASVWVKADREKFLWGGFLLVPYLNVLVLIGYAVGVLPRLLAHHQTCTANPLRRGGSGGAATRSQWPA
jgi:hypothetical protein